MRAKITAILLASLFLVSCTKTKEMAEMNKIESDTSKPIPQTLKDEIQGQHISIEDDLGAYLKVVDGSYYIKLKGNKILFSFDLEKIKDLTAYLDNYKKNLEAKNIEIEYVIYCIE
ncbi:hypothetical protein [Treponema sp.]|uniref:hypothetical protein n=1 Tax=Treponema sp. TaxID=166 RepID=UPI00298E9278|nr:hypothetical protein [Treponema sp.]MCR5613288.1 hypothetical protein [Treponema sp.]